MIKLLFWILLVANVLFLVFIRWGGELVSDGHTAQALPPLHEEKINLMTVPQIAPVAANQPSTASLHAASAPIASAPPDNDPVIENAKPVNPVCMEWSDFTGVDLNRANTSLALLQLGNKLAQRQIEHSIGYWVYIPALKGKAEQNKKLAELKSLGLEYFIEQKKGRWHNAISLGVFKTQEAAQRFLESLRAKKVNGAKVGEKASKFKSTIFVFNGLDAATVGKLSDIQRDFSGSELKNIACH